MINIAFLLTPKREVVWLSADGTLGEAIERMKPNGFAAVPILDQEGRYVGTLTEGDILWHLLDSTDTRRARATPVLEVQRRTNNRAVHIDAELETLVLRAADQNFVPVLDDREVFIGIVRRRSLIEECLLCAGMPRPPRSLRNRGTSGVVSSIAAPAAAPLARQGERP